MQIIYTRLVMQRMQQRKVEDVLPGDYGEEIAIKRDGNREVRVVYEETSPDTLMT
jgi:hypothetical protein